MTKKEVTMNKIRFLATLVFMFIIIGCANQKFLMENKDPGIPTYEGTSHFLFYAIGQTKKINPDEVCGSKGVTAVETEVTVLNGLCQGITFGIYYPMTYRIYCNKE